MKPHGTSKQNDGLSAHDTVLVPPAKVVSILDGARPPRGQEQITRKEAISAPAPHSALKGAVDGLEADFRLAGWAWSPEVPDEPTYVRVYEGDTLLVEGLADHYRPDVAAAGFGNGRLGFAFELPASLFDGQRHEFMVECRAAHGAGSICFTHTALMPTRDRRLGLPPPPADDLPGGTDGSSPRTPKAAIYVPGHVVFCGPDRNERGFPMQGWTESDGSCIWIAARDATIEMLLRRPRDAYILSLKVLPNCLDGMIPTLELFFNFFRVGFFEIPEPRLISVQLPAELFILRRAVLTFHCNGSFHRTRESLSGQRGTIGLQHWSIG